MRNNTSGVPSGFCNYFILKIIKLQATLWPYNHTDVNRNSGGDRTISCDELITGKITFQKEHLL